MALALDLLSWALLLVGSAFAFIGTLGLLRLPDVYSRMHATGITDTLGAALILAGLGVQAGLSLVTVKLVFIGLFLFFTSPPTPHAVAAAAWAVKIRPPIRGRGGDAGVPDRKD